MHFPEYDPRSICSASPNNNESIHWTLGRIGPRAGLTKKFRETYDSVFPDDGISVMDNNELS